MVRPRRPRPGRSAVLAFLSAFLVEPFGQPPLLAEKGLDKAAERFLREAHLLLLPDEESEFRSLTSTEDQKEFQKIFWARRDPDPTTARNEMEEAIAKGRARADALFTTANERGVETGCGQVFLLLGDPLEVRGADPRQVQGRGPRERFDSLTPMRDGARPPETWVYRSAPGDSPSYAGGELRIAMDDACRFAEGGRVLDDLRAVARSRVVRPGLGYRKGPDGRLVTLDALLKSDVPGAAVPATADFPLALDTKLMLRTPGGLVYAAGLVRAEPGARPGEATGAEPPAGTIAGTVVAEAVSSTGSTPVKSHRAFLASVAADGTLTASYGLSLKPGRYTLRVGLALASGKGSSTTLTLEVPDFDAPGLHVAPLILYPDEPGRPAAASDPRDDTKDPYAALAVGPLRLKPRFADAFRRADGLQVVAVLTGAKVDPATAKASLVARFTVQKDGRPVAKGGDQHFDTANAVASIGPVPLAGYAPGRYVVRLEVTDAVAGTTAVDERPFEIREQP